MSERQPGWYWVQFHIGEEWNIAKLNEFGFKLFGSTVTCPENFIDVVGPRIPPPGETIISLDEHTKHINAFLLELYQIMVDPLDNPPNIGEMCKQLVKAAVQQREQLHSQPPADSAAIRAKLEGIKEKLVINEYPTRSVYSFEVKWLIETLERLLHG